MNSTPPVHLGSTDRISLGVTIPTMNRPELLRAALRSAWDQRRKPDEIYVLDNSAERDAALEEEFRHLPLRYIHRSERVGVEKAFDLALRGPETDYVCLLEDDNLFGVDHLATMEEAIRCRPAAGVFGSAAYVFRKETGPLHHPIFAACWPTTAPAAAPSWLEPGIVLATHIYSVPFAASALAINRAVLKSTELELTKIRGPQDRWRWAQLAAKTGAVYVGRATAWYRLHESNISSDITKVQWRHENREVTRRVVQLMEANGLDPVENTRQLSALITPAAREFLAGFLIRQRMLDYLTRLLPPLLDKASFAQCLPLIPSLAWRERFGKLGF